MTATLETAEEPEERRLQFLLDEGLELLAAYRRISDPETRRAILTLVLVAGEKEPHTPKRLA